MTDGKLIRYGKDYCVAFLGELNNNLQPITSRGDLYKPGIRLCGHSDCVRDSHIKAAPKPVQRPITSKPKTKPKFDLEATLRLMDAYSDLAWMRRG